VFSFLTRNGASSYIIKTNAKSMTSHKKRQRYFREFMLGSSIVSNYVVKYVDMKRY
jgi:hypothetical protein